LDEFQNCIPKTAGFPSKFVHDQYTCSKITTGLYSVTFAQVQHVSNDSRYSSYSTVIVNPCVAQRGQQVKMKPRKEGDGRMPPAATCVRHSIVSLLSSSGEKWLKTSAVLTESSLFLSGSCDRTHAVHRIPLHEINRIERAGNVEDDSSIIKHQAVAHGPHDVGKDNEQPDYDEGSEPEEAKPEDLLASTRILQLNTAKDGLNFGRIYTLRFKDERMIEDWKSALVELRASHTKKYYRQTFIGRQQQKIQSFYGSKTVQLMMAFIIITNFIIEAISLQFNFEQDTSEAQILRNLDTFFTLVYLLDLLVNMAGHLVWNFFTNPWSVFDLVIVVISLLSLGPTKLDFVKGARLLRVFRVLRAFGRIASLRGLINALGAAIGPVLNAMFLCTCVLIIFAMFGVNLFGARSPEYFRTILAAMYTLFQIATEGSAISREMMEGDHLAPDVSVFFVVFITVEVFILLPVVVAVLVENFSIAMHKHREQEEKQKLRALRVEHMYTLDPLLESLMSNTSDQDLTSKLLLLFQTFDVDDDQVIDFQELFEGLHKMSFTPPIKLTLKEYEHIAGNHLLSNYASPMIDFRAFSSIVREQLKIYCQRRLGELISSVQEDSQQEAIHLFAFKLLIQEVDKFVAADGAGFGGQDREKSVAPCALQRGEDSKFFDIVRRRREYLKERIIYECWAYKKGEGGPFHSSAYRKRYLIITVDQHLSYYDDPECYYQEMMPNGKLSCVDMQCTSIYGNEMIEGKKCFPFTIQAKEEGLRIRHCACETCDDRDKLLASIIKGSKGPLDEKRVQVMTDLTTDGLFPDTKEIGIPVEQERDARESIFLGSFRLLEGKVVEALNREGSGSGGEGGGLKTELADMTHKADKAEARVCLLERDLKQSREWSQELHQALTESAQSLQLRLSSADRDDKVLAALQEILAAVDDLSETVIDLSQRFSSSEKEREAGKKAGATAPLLPEGSKRTCQTSIDILSQRVSQNGKLSQRISAYLKEREVERQQTTPGQQFAAGGQARDSLQTGNARAGDDKKRDSKRGAVATTSASMLATNTAASAVDLTPRLSTPRVSTGLRAGSVPAASPKGVSGKSGKGKEQVGQAPAQTLAMRTRFQRVFAYEKEREVERQQAPPGQQRQAGGQVHGSLQTGNARAGDDQQREGFGGNSGEGKEQAGRSLDKAQTQERSEILRWRQMHWQGPVVKSPVGDVVMLSDQWVPSTIEDDGSGGGVMQNYIPAGPGAGDSRNRVQGHLQQNLQHHPFANPSITNPLRRAARPQFIIGTRELAGGEEHSLRIRDRITPPARTRAELGKG
jgi:voltage-gated sodium channel